MNRLVIALLLVLCPYYVSYGQDYVSLQDKQGRSFLVEVDPATGAANRVLNPSVNLDDYGIDHRHLNSQAIDRVTHQLLDDFSPILNLDANQVQLQRADTDGTMWFVSYRQVHRGVPVAWTEIGYTINSSGEVITLGTRSYPNVEVATMPSISSAAAVTTARDTFNEDHVEIRGDAELIIAPDGTEDGRLHLTWKVGLFSPRSLRYVSYYIDAHSGEMVRISNNMRESHAHAGSRSTGKSGQRQQDSFTAEEQDLSRAQRDLGIAVFHRDKIIATHPAGQIRDTLAYAAGYPARNHDIETPAGLVTLQGQITGAYFPGDHNDNTVSAPFSTRNIKVFNASGQLMGYFHTDANGDYSVTMHLATAQYFLHIPLESDWVKLYEYLNDFVGSDDVTYTYPFTASGTVVTNHHWSGAISANVADAANVRYHVHRAHDIFKASPLNFNGMDYQMRALVNRGSGRNGRARDGNLEFGSMGGFEWAKASDVIYHEYTHNVIVAIYGAFISSGSFELETHAMDEGIPDYFACSFTEDPIFGESVGLSRNLDNSLTFSPSNDFYWNGQVIGGAIWDVRGATDPTTADRLAFTALQITPHARTFEAFGYNMLLADREHNGGSQ